MSEINLEGVSIKFSSDQKPELPNARTHPSGEIASEAITPKVLLTEEDREALRQMDELQLAIDDPVAFEEQQLSESVENARMRDVHAEATEDRGPE